MGFLFHSQDEEIIDINKLCLHMNKIKQDIADTKSELQQHRSQADDRRIDLWNAISKINESIKMLECRVDLLISMLHVNIDVDKK